MITNAQRNLAKRRIAVAHLPLQSIIQIYIGRLVGRDCTWPLRALDRRTMCSALPLIQMDYGGMLQWAVI